MHRFSGEWYVHREFSYESSGETILKIGPHLPKLLSNIKQLTFLEHGVVNGQNLKVKAKAKTSTIKAKAKAWTFEAKAKAIGSETKAEAKTIKISPRGQVLASRTTSLLPHPTLERHCSKPHVYPTFTK